MKEINKFWLNKTLEELSPKEWESLCDGCGKCCLEKIEDEDTGTIYTTAISCRLLDCTTCKCTNYTQRFKYMDDCIKLTPKKVREIKWLPHTCGYRLVKEGKDLPSWHPLITKDMNSTISSGNSAKEFAIHPVEMTEHISEYVIYKEEV